MDGWMLRRSTVGDAVSQKNDPTWAAVETPSLRKGFGNKSEPLPAYLPLKLVLALVMCPRQDRNPTNHACPHQGTTRPGQDLTPNWGILGAQTPAPALEPSLSLAALAVKPGLGAGLAAEQPGIAEPCPGSWQRCLLRAPAVPAGARIPTHPFGIKAQVQG